MSRYHHSQEWARARRERLDLDGWRCQDCGRPGRLEVHHLHSLRDGGDHSLANLRTLCRECHLDAHRAPQTDNEKAWKSLIEELL